MSVKKKNKLFLLVLISSSIALIGAALYVRGELQVVEGGSKGETEVNAAVPVTVATIRRRGVEVRAESHGFLQPYTEVTVAAQVPGVVTEQCVEISDLIRAGETLFKIDDALRKIEYERALAAAARAASRYELADANWQRVEGLSAKGSSVPIEDVEARTGRSAAGASAAEADAWVRQAALTLERTSIVSPLDGVVSQIFIRQGEFAQISQPAARIIEVDRLKLLAEVADRDVVWLRVGQACSLTAPLFPLGTFTGTVIRVYPQALATSRKFEVEIEVPNADGRLRPGFFMRAVFSKPQNGAPAESAPFLVVPRLAVGEEDGEQFCYVVEPGDQTDYATSMSRGRRVAIVAVPIPAEPENLRVVTGLQEGDRVVITGARHLSDGAIVRIAE